MAWGPDYWGAALVQPAHQKSALDPQGHLPRRAIPGLMREGRRETWSQGKGTFGTLEPKSGSCSHALPPTGDLHGGSALCTIFGPQCR